MLYAPLQRRRSENDFSEKAEMLYVRSEAEQCCLNEPKASEFIFAPKNYLSEGSHAAGVTKLPGAILLVLFF